MDRAPRTDAVRSVILVERYLSTVTPQRLAQLAADTRAAVAAQSARSAELTYLTSREALLEPVRAGVDAAKRARV